MCIMWGISICIWSLGRRCFSGACAVNTLFAVSAGIFARAAVVFVGLWVDACESSRDCAARLFFLAFKAITSTHAAGILAYFSIRADDPARAAVISVC